MGNPNKKFEIICDEKLLHLKSFSQTRWRCLYETMKALFINYYNILCTLGSISENVEEKPLVPRGGKILEKEIHYFSFLFVRCHEILERFGSHC